MVPDNVVPFPPVFTADEAAASVGKWVEVKGRGELALIIKATGEAILIRYARHDGAYQTVLLSGLIRRADLDDSPEPLWLTRARNSARPPLILHDVLNPQYSRAALEPRAGELDPVTRGIFHEACRMARAQLRHAIEDKDGVR